MTESPRILLHHSETKPLVERLLRALPHADFRECNTFWDLPAQIEDYRPEVVFTVRFAVAEAYPRSALFSEIGPRWIANGGVGTDHFGRWDPTRTTVTNSAGVAADMMAEFVIGGFLHFTLDIPGLEADKAECFWRIRMVRPIKEGRLLIVGLGHTGRAIAARAKAFGMRVAGTRAHPRTMRNVDDVRAAEDLPLLLPEADFIAVATPLTPRTRGMIGPSEFAAMKPGVIIADVSRGGVVDQSALLTALESGHVAAAALDVFETEPLPESSPLWRHDNVLISPHCSSVYEGWEMASFDLFLANLKRWMTGRELANVVDPDRGY